jgi:hypothetical protein
MLGSAYARVAFLGFMLLILLLGGWIAGTGFHDPDTCWLLALGRWMWEHHALPAADPFSFTFALVPDRLFIMYQWLTELFFYACVNVGGLMFLIAVVALMFYCAFIYIPMAAFNKLGLTRLRSFLLVFLALLSASFHTLIRPEIVSYLLLSCWLAMMLAMRGGDEKEAGEAPARVDWRMIAGFCGLMTLWVNMHTAFTIPLAMLLLYVTVSTLQWLLSKNRGAFPYTTALLSLVGALLCTLINPYGVGLWQYIPQLFFMPLNRFIDELRPFSGNLKDVTYYPFIVLTIVSACECVKMWRSQAKPRASWFSPIEIAILIIVAFYCRRLIPFHAIALIYECAWMRAHRQLAETKGVVHYANEALRRLFAIDRAWFGITIAIVEVGVCAVATGPVKPQCPQPSVAFQNPTDAISYLKEHPPVGHGFNSPQFGDVMIWDLSPVPQLFVDTRFDMYGAGLLNQYLQIALCKEGWRERLDGYKIDWVLIGPKQPLAKELSASADWTKQVDSKAALYFTRNVPLPDPLVNPSPKDE